MKSLYLSLFAILILFTDQSIADIQIQKYRAKYFWKDEWTQTLLNELKKDEYKISNTGLLNIEIDEEDLDELECDGYNSASFEQKSDFWVVLFSALSRAESGFNTKAKSAKSKGHRSIGLLQLSRETAKTRCHISPPESDVLNPNDNLICGLKLMNWQLLGGPVSENHKLRADLENQIFGKYMFQWGPLRQNDHRGRALLVNWLKDHLNQLKFCHKNN